VYGATLTPSGVSGQDLGRLAATFAHEVSTLSRQIMVITQELRAGLTAFRIESGARQEPTLYPPGSGYAEGPAPHADPRDGARSPYATPQAPNPAQNPAQNLAQNLAQRTVWNARSPE